MTDWEDLLPGYKDGKYYSAHEITQAQGIYNYIFDNKDGNGLEEFMSHLMTNKMFRQAMSNVSALDKTTIDENSHLVDKIVEHFKNFIAKLAGFITHTKDQSITDAGTKLLFDLMKANDSHANKASRMHPLQASDAVMDYIGDTLDKMDTKLKPLVDTLISVPLGEITKKKAKDIKDMTKVEQSTRAVKMVAKVVAANKAAIVRDKKVDKLKSTGTGFVARSRNTLLDSVKLLNNLYTFARVAANMREAKELNPKEYALAMRHFSHVVDAVEQSLIGKFLADFATKDAMYNTITDAILTLTHAVDKLREGTYEEVLANTKEWFGKIPINKDAYKEQNKALSDVVLRTDIQSLDLDAKGLRELLRDPEKVTAKILELRAKVKKAGNDGMVKDAGYMAQYMVTGAGPVITNAKNIALGYGRDDTAHLATSELIKDIDQLISYEAFQLTDSGSKQVLLDFVEGNDYHNFNESTIKELGYKYGIIKGEHLTKAGYKQQVEDGINSFMDHSYGSQLQSAAELKHNPHNIIKGYMKESFDTGVEVIFKPIRDRAELEDNGYKYQRRAKPMEGSKTEYGMFVRLDGKNKRVNGALGLQSTKSRGFTLLDKINEESENSPASMQLDSIAKKKLFEKALKNATEKYTDNRGGSDMSPMYNSFGDIINFRRTMTIQEKEAVMDMETRGTQNLARTYSTFGTAEATFEHNKEVLRKIKADADKNYADNPSNYVVIRPRKGIDAEAYGLEENDVVEPANMTKHEQMWARIPKTTQEYATELYTAKDGDNVTSERQIIIRKDLLVAAFGEDEISLADQRIADKMGAKARQNAKWMERYWQDLMQIAKSNIVIKTPAVLMGNIISNAKILYYIGVNPVKGAKLVALSARELKRYEADSKELHNLERSQVIIKNKRGKEFAKNNRRIDVLKDEIANNLAAPLIDAGMFQSIVEDVSTKKETNRVSNFVNSKVDKYVTNETANTAIQYMFMTERTKPFQAMLKATQVSDFHFRFAQYHDAIDNKGMSPKQALRDVTDNYINYEAPLNEWVRYGDKMGTWFFVRYFVGIQRVIKKIAKKNPGRVGMELMAELTLGDTDGIEDQSILTKGFATYNFDLLGHVGDVIIPPGGELVYNYTH